MVRTYIEIILIVNNHFVLFKNVFSHAENQGRRAIALDNILLLYFNRGVIILI